MSGTMFQTPVSNKKYSLCQSATEKKMKILSKVKAYTNGLDLDYERYDSKETKVHTAIPSSTSPVVSKEEDDSIDRTPSGPTLSIASAIMVPISSSFPAEIEAIAGGKTIICKILIAIHCSSNKRRKINYL